MRNYFIVLFSDVIRRLIIPETNTVIKFTNIDINGLDNFYSSAPQQYKASVFLDTIIISHDRD